MSAADERFDPTCTRCPRLAGHLAAIRSRFPGYHARPVPSFGDPRARLLIVGLAPGLHGANATGRPFTGDHAGILLYRTLARFGFANQAEATGPDDGLELSDCRISNAVKCLPPGNKPTTAEVKECNAYLAAELAGLDAGGVVLALGRIAHDAVARALGEPLTRYPFAHGALHALGESGRWLLDSYHCSRYNTQTRRLTDEMFEAVFARACELLGRAA